MLVLTRKFNEAVVIRDVDTDRCLVVIVQRTRRSGVVKLLFDGDPGLRVMRTEPLDPAVVEKRRAVREGVKALFVP